MENIKYQGRCMKCKLNKEMQNTSIVEFGTKGMKAVKGTCPTCGTRMFKILPKQK